MLSLALQRYRAAFAGLPREAWLLAIVLLVNRSGTMVLPFMTLYLTDELHMSEASAGRLISVYGLGSICGAYLGGRMAQRYGELRVLTVCMFLAAPAYLVVPLWSSWGAIAASLFVLSAIAETVRPANATAIAKFTTRENRTRAYALQRLALNLGFSIGPALGGLLATVNFMLLFVVDALTTLLAAIALWHFFHMRRITPAAGETHSAAHPPQSPLRDRPFVAYLAIMTVFFIVFFQFGSTYPLYLRDHFSMGKPMVGLMFAVNTILIVAVEMLLVDFIRGWPLLRTIGWGCFLTCLGFGMLPFGSSWAYCVAAMLVLTVGEMLAMPLSAGYVANRSRPGTENLYMGWYTLSASLAFVLGPAISSALYQQNRDWPWIASLLTGIGLLGVLYLLSEWMGDDVEDPAKVVAAAESSDGIPLSPPAPVVVNESVLVLAGEP